MFDIAAVSLDGRKRRRGLPRSSHPARSGARAYSTSCAPSCAA